MYITVNKKHILSRDASVSTDGSNLIINPQDDSPLTETIVVDVKNQAAAILLGQLLAESIEDGEDASISISRCSSI